MYGEICIARKLHVRVTGLPLGHVGQDIQGTTEFKSARSVCFQALDCPLHFKQHTPTLVFMTNDELITLHGQCHR